MKKTKYNGATILSIGMVVSFLAGCGETQVTTEEASTGTEIGVTSGSIVQEPAEGTDQLTETASPTEEVEKKVTYSNYEYVMANIATNPSPTDSSEWIGFNLPASFRGYYNRGYFDYDEGYEFCYWGNFGGSSTLYITDDTGARLIADDHELKFQKSDFENDPELTWRNTVVTSIGEADIYSTISIVNNDDGTKNAGYYAETAFISNSRVL